MASLLDRMGVPNRPGVVRTRSSHSSRSSTPYTRPTTKLNSDGMWGHDGFEQEHNLKERLHNTPKPPKVTITQIARDALESATGGVISIKGASTQQNTVEVSGLVAGTTTADVAAIFKRCGAISKTQLMPSREIRIRVTFKDPKHAAAAVTTFDKQQADGRTLSVKIVGLVAEPKLAGRLTGDGGVNLAREEGSVDALMASPDDSGSKMRSDALVKNPRAQVLTSPPGTSSSEDHQTRGGRGGRGRGRGRGSRQNGGRRGSGKRMDID